MDTIIHIFAGFGAASVLVALSFIAWFIHWTRKINRQHKRITSTDRLHVDCKCELAPALENPGHAIVGYSMTKAERDAEKIIMDLLNPKG